MAKTQWPCACGRDPQGGTHAFGCKAINNAIYALLESPQPTPEPHLAAAYGEMEVAAGSVTITGYEALSPDYWKAQLDHIMAEIGPAMTPQSPLTAATQIATSGLCVVADGVTSHRSGSWTAVDIQRCDCADEVCPCIEPEISEADRNLYYDGIILAARKKREALAWMDEPLTDDERDICHQMWDEQERAERVASALSKPLDHEPRLGWKPGDCE